MSNQDTLYKMVAEIRDLLKTLAAEDCEPKPTEGGEAGEPPCATCKYAEKRDEKPGWWCGGLECYPIVGWHCTSWQAKADAEGDSLRSGDWAKPLHKTPEPKVCSCATPWAMRPRMVNDGTCDCESCKHWPSGVAFVSSSHLVCSGWTVKATEATKAEGTCVHCIHGALDAQRACGYRCTEENGEVREDAPCSHWELRDPFYPVPPDPCAQCARCTKEPLGNVASCDYRGNIVTMSRVYESGCIAYKPTEPRAEDAPEPRVLRDADTGELVEPQKAEGTCIDCNGDMATCEYLPPSGCNPVSCKHWNARDRAEDSPDESESPPTMTVQPPRGTRGPYTVVDDDGVYRGKTVWL